MPRRLLLSLGVLAILQNILSKAHLLLQVSDLLLIACILSHPLISHVPEKLHSDPQTDHQVHLVQTTIANASASFVVLDLTANVWCDVLLDA
jgi:thiol:disulfide interchange protein